jgi:hypothetical protein
VDTVGTPVLVRASYFPEWQASGAGKVYRVTPNLMVVVPTSHDVSLHYGHTPVDMLGWFSTALGVIGVVVLYRWDRRFQPVLRPRRPRPPDPEEPVVIGWDETAEASGLVVRRAGADGMGVVDEPADDARPTPGSKGTSGPAGWTVPDEEGGRSKS